MKEIEAAYDKIVAQIRAQYSLGYVSTNTAPDGTLAQGRDQGPAPGPEGPARPVPQGLLRALQT